MLLLRRLSWIDIRLELSDWQGYAVVIVVEMQSRLKNGEHEEDCADVHRPLIEAFAFPRSEFLSATASSSTGIEAQLPSFSYQS